MPSLNGTVYIVEDNNSFRKSIVRLVQNFGYRTAAFETATAFLSISDYQHPGCVLLDMQLPDLDGLKLREALMEKGCRLPVIFMSGHGDISIYVRAMKKGAVDLLPKPFDPEDLRKAIILAIVRSTHET